MTRGRTALTRKSIELPNGVKLEYVEQGDPSGIPVLFLHGVTDSWHSFEPVLPYVPASIHAFALSQRGHGDADRPAAGYGPHEFAADVAAFMNTLTLGSAVIAGHSMSTSVAQRLALDYPGRTQGLVLMGSFVAGWRSAPEVVKLWKSAVSTLADPIDPDFVREFQESTLAQPIPSAFLDTVIQESLKVPARVWRAVFHAFLEADFSEELRKIVAPTLIVWGDQDALIPRHLTEILAAMIPNSRLVVHPGAGHAFHWEEPEHFAADLVAFTERIVR
ncbi:MAG TPA: alpha/beta hydrolase [Nitrospiraceae bacterium]|nr:alpha/beta hydrolase [Nitrospiraceae bacterium]